MESGQKTPRWCRFAPGLVAATGAMVFMVWLAAAKWESLPTIVVTRQAADQHGETTVPRALAALTMPGVLLLLTILFCVAVAIGRDNDSPVRTALTGGARAPRGLGWALVGLSPVLAVAQAGGLSEFAGEPFQATKWITVAVGWLMICCAFGVVERPAPNHAARKPTTANPPLYNTGAVILASSGALGSVIALAGPWLAGVVIIGVGMLAGCGLMLTSGVILLAGGNARP
ncbi:MAG: hypothetical protein LBK95_11230 [Bifidobacteriaceae bacterium]|jgi:hypothetical protein|nr:hypothetical protein [Bifidobacteriaceae bacterium]